MSAGNGYQRDVVVGEVQICGVMVVRPKGAALFPAGTKHEMLNEQLAAPLEKIGQRFPAIRAFEDVVLLDADPGQFAPAGTDLVPQAGESFFLLQEFLAGNEPLLVGNDRMKFEAFGSRVSDHAKGCFGIQ
jgi:hypothetical protein